MVRRLICPWTNIPVSFKLKLNLTDPRLQNDMNMKQSAQRYLILITIAIIFLIILFITMDLRKDKDRRRPKMFSKESWIHDKDSVNHYGIVLDCGSSGTRVFIYYWPDHNGNPEHLLNIHQVMDRDGQPVQLKVRPGKVNLDTFQMLLTRVPNLITNELNATEWPLNHRQFKFGVANHIGISTYEDKPENASTYVYPLLRHAANHIPTSKHSETPLYIFATAGMRLLPKVKQDAILNNLIKNIPLRFNFLFSSTHVEVITGKQEGIFAWITINYVLGRFNHSHETTGVHNVSVPSRKSTVGSLDMGGASTQMTLEVPQNEKLPAHLTTEVNLGCDSHMMIHKYKLYVTTFLGYGASTARSRYLDKILKMRNSSVHSHSRIYLDPCLPTDIRIKGTHKGIKYRLKGIGDFDICRNQLLPLLNKTVPCQSRHCSFNGVHQPPILFNKIVFYGFSEFWYSVNDVLRLKGVYNAQNFDKASKEFCKTKWSVLHKRYTSQLYPLADEHRFMYQCFKSAWMTTVLHKGFNFPKNYRKLHPTFLIDGKEIQWTLGAILYRTRFLPLREMQSQQFITRTKGKYSSFQVWFNFSDSGFKTVLLVCSLIVIASIFIVCKRLRYISPSKSAAFSGKQGQVSKTPNYPRDFRIAL